MKKLFYIFVWTVCLFGFGQPPQKFSYQAIVRDSNNQLITNRTVGMQVSIFRSGSPVYVERHTPTTNDNGLVTLEIGGGLVVQGNFTQIDWSLGNYFLQTEIDPAGGATFLITSFTELLSVPYAQHAKTAESLAGAPKPLEIGDSFQGGIIFWLDEGGQHGLVADTDDLSGSSAWSNGALRKINTSDGVYAGEMNTNAIIALQTQDNPNGLFAALRANLTSVNSNGIAYGDWYLPSIVELILLMAQRTLVGGFTGTAYWSSTEISQTSAAAISLGGAVNSVDKSSQLSVRLIRAF